MIGTSVFGGFALLLLVVAVLAFVLYLIPVRLWISAWASGAYVGLFSLIGMRFRRVPPGTVVTDHLRAYSAAMRDLKLSADHEQGPWKNTAVYNHFNAHVI